MREENGSINLLKQLLDNIGDNIFFKDCNSKFIMISKENARSFGLKDPDDAIGMDDFDFFDNAHARKQLKEEQLIMNTGEAIVCEEQASSREGGMEWGSVTKMPLRDNSGRIVGTMGIARDITELKNKEEKLKKALDQIAEDLRMAAKLQQTFLPQSYPSFIDSNGRSLIQFYHFYEADIELGGDFCSVYRLGDSKAGLLICDVMGHGVRSALITGIIYTIADEIIQQSKSPGDFLTALNQRLAPILQSGDEFLFATAAFIIIDVVSGEVAGSLAGHPPPFLIQPKKKKVSKLEIASEMQGPALAIMNDYSYQSIYAHMNPGDELLMYTDGIFEAMNASGTEFGEEQLRKTIENYNELPLQELVSRIIEVVQGYTGSKRMGDDTCLLGFKLLPVDC